jgi:hypothetical protein
MGLFKKTVKQLFPNTEIVIEEAFKIDGETYYRFADLNNLPYKRGLMAYAVYNELDMRCTREYLEQHTKAIENILSKGEINVFDIKKLNDQMKQRLALDAETDLMYKLASVAYFDKNESPEGYDVEYNKKKIEKWKKHSSVEAFFLSKPLMELLPFLSNVGFDLNTYSELNKQLNEIHSDILHSLSSKKR